MNCPTHSSSCKPIPGYQGLYEICEYGCLRSLSSNNSLKHYGMWKKPFANDKGYLRYGLSSEGKYKTVVAHRLVMATWGTPQPSQLHQIDHIDFNKQNNHISNLRWVTSKENVQAAKAIRTKRGIKEKPRNIGSRNPHSKLDENKVANILHMRGAATAIFLRDAYGFSTTTCIYDIWNRKSWKHVL